MKEWVKLHNTRFDSMLSAVQHKAKPSAAFIPRHDPECCIFYTHKHSQCFKWYIALSVAIEAMDSSSRNVKQTRDVDMCKLV